MPLLTSQRTSLALQTRNRSDIKNDLCRVEPDAGLIRLNDDYVAEYQPQGNKFRGVGPCNTYNCHGMTFAARRSTIWIPGEVKKILQEDDYQRIAKQNVMPGDIVTYFSTGKNPGSVAGDVEHSGIVLELLLLQMRVLSKWGFCDEVIHFLTQVPYDIGDIRFFRVTK
jgi:hypothetical protein